MRTLLIVGILALVLVAGCSQKVTSEGISDSVDSMQQNTQEDLPQEVQQDVDQDLIDDEYVEIGSLI